MSGRDWLLVAANLHAHDGRHFVEGGRRMMEYRGSLFVWDPHRETWVFREA